MTDQTHAYAEDARNVRGTDGNGSDFLSFSFDLGTDNLALADTVFVFKAAKDCLLTDAIWTSTDMDSGTPILTFDIGTASAVDGIFAAAVGSAVTTTIGSNEVIISEDDVIQIKVKVAPTTAVAGTVTLGFRLTNI